MCVTWTVFLCRAADLLQCPLAWHPWLGIQQSCSCPPKSAISDLKMSISPFFHAFEGFLGLGRLSGILKLLSFLYHAVESYLFRIPQQMPSGLLISHGVLESAHNSVWLVWSRVSSYLFVAYSILPARTQSFSRLLGDIFHFLKYCPGSFNSLVQLLQNLFRLLHYFSLVLVENSLCIIWHCLLEVSKLMRGFRICMLDYLPGNITNFLRPWSWVESQLEFCTSSLFPSPMLPCNCLPP